MKQTQNSKLGLYIHIPFCKSKCLYCDFYSLPRSEEQMDRYTAALIKHLEELAPHASRCTVDTIYFGGGTPSYLGVKRLKSLLGRIKKLYHVKKNAEITLEANPESLNEVGMVRALRRAGFNRVSLGVQSADDGELHAVGRIHTFEQVRKSVDAIRKGKIKNLSLDLIYGLPGQTMERWQKNSRAFPPVAIPGMHSLFRIGCCRTSKSWILKRTTPRQNTITSSAWPIWRALMWK